MELHGINFPEERIAALCARHGVKRLALFGSILTEDFRPESDVDVLVEFEPDARPSLMTLAAIAVDLEAMCGREVDIVEPAVIPPRYARRIEAGARVLHAA